VIYWFFIEVHFLNGRYHGRNAETGPEWPPAPLRLFEAITAGALSGRWSVEDRPATEAALRWIESLGPPEIVVGPIARGLRPCRLAVPNNQADRHIPALRKGALLDKLLAADKELKVVWPWLVGSKPLIYAWPIADDACGQAEAARPVVRRLIVLGTGLDHAVADARVTTKRPLANDLVSFPAGASPCEGTLASLVARHNAQLERLKTGSLREIRPQLRFLPASPATSNDIHLLFAFRTSMGGPDRSLPVEPEATAVVAHAIRLKLADRLTEALRRRPESARGVSPELMERLVIGRNAGPADTEQRIKIAPLPSIGHEHADALLRRLLISVPSGFPVPAESIRRALANLEFDIDLEPTRSLHLRLVPIQDDDQREHTMRDRYLGTARVWRSVSPVILPGHRRYAPPAEPSHAEAEQAQGRVRGYCRRRADEEELFRRALKHSGLDIVDSFRMRREPFSANQLRSDANWALPNTGDHCSRKWLSGRPRVHVEVTFDKARQGPLLIGDGRFLGLGLLHAVRDQPPDRPEAARYRLGTRGRPRVELTARMADVLRRALMSGGFPPPEISGHDDYGPLRTDPAHSHAFFLPEDVDGDELIDHITVYSRRGFSDDALERLHRVGRLWWPDPRTSAQRTSFDLTLESIGRLESIAGLARLIGPSEVWCSATPYFRPRFTKRCQIGTDSASLSAEQIQREWAVRFPFAPAPNIRRLANDVPRRTAAKFDVARSDRDRAAPDKQGSFLELRFPNPVVGPISLGRAAHYGLGLFVALGEITRKVIAADGSQSGGSDCGRREQRVVVRSDNVEG
jgi:CRISPR-associated protein Csb2